MISRYRDSSSPSLYGPSQCWNIFGWEEATVAVLQNYKHRILPCVRSTTLYLGLSTMTPFRLIVRTRWISKSLAIAEIRQRWTLDAVLFLGTGWLLHAQYWATNSTIAFKCYSHSKTKKGSGGCCAHKHSHRSHHFWPLCVHHALYTISGQSGVSFILLTAHHHTYWKYSDITNKVSCMCIFLELAKPHTSVSIVVRRQVT